MEKLKNRKQWIMTSAKSRSCDWCANLYDAAKYGHYMYVDALLRDYDDKRQNEDLYTSDLKRIPFTLASYHGHLDCMKLLLSAGAGVNDHFRRPSALQNSAMNGPL